MEIPENRNSEQRVVEELAGRMYEHMVAHNGYSCWYAKELPGRDIAIAAARLLVAKGYYAKINHFVEPWKGYQCVVVSDKPFECTNAKMVYSEMIRI